MKSLMLWTAASCLLAACAAGPQPMPVHRIAVPPPPNLTSPPQTLPPPLSGRMKDLEANHLQVTQAYHQLASQQCRLLAFLGINHEECRQFTAPPVQRP
jgi:hypothetical protein